MTFSIGEKIRVGKKVSTISTLGPLLAMPSGQGLNMTLLAILKVDGANWLLVLEKNWSCGKMFLLLTRYHYWLDNIIDVCIASFFHVFSRTFVDDQGPRRLFLSGAAAAMSILVRWDPAEGPAGIPWWFTADRDRTWQYSTVNNYTGQEWQESCNIRKDWMRNYSGWIFSCVVPSLSWH